MAKDYFTEKGIAYTDYDVAADMEKRKEVIQKSGQMGVPVIIIDNNLRIGRLGINTLYRHSTWVYYVISPKIPQFLMKLSIASGGVIVCDDVKVQESTTRR